jgi:hypothetical protein
VVLVISLPSPQAFSVVKDSIDALNRTRMVLQEVCDGEAQFQAIVRLEEDAEATG